MKAVFGFNTLPTVAHRLRVQRSESTHCHLLASSVQWHKADASRASRLNSHWWMSIEKCFLGVLFIYSRCCCYLRVCIKHHRGSRSSPLPQTLNVSHVQFLHMKHELFVSASVFLSLHGSVFYLGSCEGAGLEKQMKKGVILPFSYH